MNSHLQHPQGPETQAGALRLAVGSTTTGLAHVGIALLLEEPGLALLFFLSSAIYVLIELGMARTSR